MPPPSTNLTVKPDRFSLLLLEPGEIYFKDLAVTYCSDPDFRPPPGSSGSSLRRSSSAFGVKIVNGWLKICSKSLVFVPTESSDPLLPESKPLIKLPLVDCTCIKEWEPKSFQCIFANKSNVLSVTSKSKVEMLTDNKVAPFKFTKLDQGAAAGKVKNKGQGQGQGQTTTFVFSLQHSKLDDELPLIAQLQRAATLPAVEQRGMIATMVYSTQSRTDFDHCWLESVSERILLKTVGNKISPLVVNPGKIVLTTVTLYFQPYNNAEDKPVIKVKLTSIKRIFQRRYLLRPLGLEIEYLDLKGRTDHIYLTFSKPEERQKLYHKLIIARQELELANKNNSATRDENSSSVFNTKTGLHSSESNGQQQQHPLSVAPAPAAYSSPAAVSDIVTSLAPCTGNLQEENMTLQWQNGLISNLEYLLYLNSAADRSFNDLTQYPVMPWIIADYQSSELDLTNPATFRDLSKPMGALNAERLAALKDRTQDMPEPRFLYGSHYSTPGFVLYFLARKIPECMLCLQNGRFDHPDRMFNSVPQTWINVTTHPSDFKELIPEFYMTEYKGEFLVNARNIDFGVRHCGTPVGDVRLPPWAANPEDFVGQLNRAMESDYVSRNLHKWIDLIFGYKQRGKNAEAADNVYYHLCYEGSVDLDSIVDIEKRYALELQIGEFGQVPKQLFTSPHPQRMANSSVSSAAANANSSSSQKSSSSSKSQSGSSSLSKLHRNSLIGGSDDEDELNSLLLSSSGNANAMHSNTKRWKTNMKDLRMVSDFKAHKERLATVAVSADNLWIFSASHDNILKMFSLEEMSNVRTVSIGTRSISCCLPLPNNQTVLLGSWDHSICAYSVEHSRSYEFANAHRDAISCLDWRKGILASGSWDGLVKVWHCTEVSGYHVNNEAFIASLEHASQVSAVAICPDNSRQLVSGTREGNVVLWCLKTASVILELPSHTRQVNGVKFSPDAQRVLSCGSDFFMKVIDLRTGSILFSKDLGEELNCLAFDGRTVLVGGASGHINIWDIHQVKFCGRIAAHKPGPVTALCVSEDGQVVATGGEDRRVVVWTTKPLIPVIPPEVNCCSTTPSTTL